MRTTPLHQLPENKEVATGGRVNQRDGSPSNTPIQLELYNAHTRLLLHCPDVAGSEDVMPGELVQVEGYRKGDAFFARTLTSIHRPTADAPSWVTRRDFPLVRALNARDETNRLIHDYFHHRDFLEVETPAWVLAPGCDPHLEPVKATFEGPETRTAYLHTSPELEMKRLLAAGSGPIYQLTKVWRNGEVTDLHNPEFTLLEWYRPWEELDAIIDDVEALVKSVLHIIKPGRTLATPIRRITMQEVVQRSCGFDILEALDAESLHRQIADRNLLSTRALEVSRWDELFFALTVAHLDPFLKKQGAVFVTHWPAPLAILARRHSCDPRVAERFELYIDGVELANGFGELTDPVEQRARFEEGNESRRALGLDELPIPEAFLAAMEWGIPPSSGVALGVDRLLMLATAATRLSDISPFALFRDPQGIQWP